MSLSALEKILSLGATTSSPTTSDTRFLFDSLGPAEGDFKADTRLLPCSEPDEGVLGPKLRLDDEDLLSPAGSVLAR